MTACEVPVMQHPDTRLAPTCEIRRVLYSDLNKMPEFSPMVERYADESAIPGMPRPNRQSQMYLHMEQANLIHWAGAFVDGRLVGFVSLLASVLPHYGAMVGTTESFFVEPEYRKTGAGKMLLREAEKIAASLGAVALLVSAPSGGRLEAVLPRSGYQESNRVFFRRLG